MRLEEKRDGLVADNRIPFAQSGPQPMAQHVTYGGTAKRRYFYEEGSSLHSPLIRTAAEFLFIGAHSYINAGGYCRGSVMIGRFCSIGRRVTIGAGMHNMGGLSTSALLEGTAGETQRSNAGAVTIIESDVWIGDGAIIMPGCRIGSGAVIGANAVVTRDVLPYLIVGGTPARVIRPRFEAPLAAALHATAWWEYPLDALRGIDTRSAEGALAALSDLPAPPPYPTYFLDTTLAEGAKAIYSSAERASLGM